MSAPNRRAIIGAAGLAAVVSIVPGVRALASPVQGTGSRLTRLIALHDRVLAACERFDECVEGPARRACDAAIAAHPAEPPLPHEQSVTTFVNVEGQTRRLCTSQFWIEGPARRVADDPTWADVGDEDWRQAHREIAAAFDRRNAAIAAQAARKREFEAEMRARYRLAEIASRSEALYDRRWNIWQAALQTPAASLGELVTKLDFIGRMAGDEAGDDEFAAIAADLRRLAGEAQS